MPSAHSLLTLESNKQEQLRTIFAFFGNMSFMRHQDEGFDKAVIRTAYKKEQNAFCETVTLVARSDVPSNANIINSHTNYKVKINGYQSLLLKARIAPHSNKNSLKHELRTDCCICSPIGLRIVLMMAAMMAWPLRKDDMEPSFLQTGAAQRDVYVIPDRECIDRRFL